MGRLLVQPYAAAVADRSPLQPFGNEAVYALFRPDLDKPTTADVEEVILRDLHKLPVPWIQPKGHL